MESILVRRSSCLLRNQLLRMTQRVTSGRQYTNMSDVIPHQDLTSIGLGGHSPVGLLQTVLNYVHLHTGLPWWATIATVTVTIRLAMVPLSIKTYTYGANFVNVRVEAAGINANIMKLRQEGRDKEADEECARLVNFFADNNASPLKMIITPCLQLPIFLTFLYSIRQMSLVPIESMKMGGALWFTDITSPDPYYLLPAMSALMFMINFELGAETGVETELLHKMKVCVRVGCLMLVPLASFLPSSIFVYWFTSGLYSLLQSSFLRVPRVRNTLGIPLISKQ